MRGLSLWLTSFVLLALASTLCAQTASPPASSQGQPPVGSPIALRSVDPGVEEIQPPIYYLRDKQGRLQPVIGIPFEEFRRIYDQIHGLASVSDPLPYVLKKITVTGQAEAHYARLTIQCDILFRRQGMIRIPLALDRIILNGTPQYDGKASPVLAPDEKTQRYSVSLEGVPDKQHRLTIKALVPLASVGGKSTLRLRVPPATESELTLTVPLVDAIAESSEGTILQTSPLPEKQGTRLFVQGSRGDFELSWHKPEIRSTTIPTVLESTGEILARFDNEGIHCSATLRIVGHGKPFDRLRVQLPIHSELVPSDESDYRIVELDDTPSTAKTGRIVEISLPQKTLGPVTIRLATRRALDTSMFSEWIELTGFGLLGATRQSGFLAVEVSDELDLLWNPQLGIQQTEDLPDSLIHENLITGFQYFTQPCSLLVRISPRQTRVSVEPQFLVFVDAEQLQLETTLKYSVRGKKARVFEVNLRDWHYDEVGPENVVDVDRVVQDKTGRLLIPLRQPSSGKIELVIKAHRHTGSEAAEKDLRLTFPRPKATSPNPAAVVLLPEDRIQLTVDNEATVGLNRQQAAPPMTIPERQQPPLFFRADPTKAILVVKQQIHAQQIAVAATSNIVVDDNAAAVRQNFSYKIDYEPIDSLTLELPSELADSERLEFRLDGELLTPIDITPLKADSQGSPSTRSRFQLPLGSPRIGTCDLEIRYPLEPHHLVERSCIRRVVPLMMPVDGVLTSNRLTITSPIELEVLLNDGPWTSQPILSESTSPANRSSSQFITTDRVCQVELSLCLDSRQTTEATVVDRALIQTHLTSRRQDRAIFHLTTREKSLRIFLPHDTDLSQAAVLLNGKPATFRPSDETSIQIDFPQNATTDRWFVEVRTHALRCPPLRGKCRIELPHLGPNVWTRRIYWQLTLPKSEHIVGVPSNLVREFRWAWNGMFWGRCPLLNTSDLETWIGLPQNHEPSRRCDSYLFSDFGVLDSAELVIMSRSWIVLGASGAALVFGLLLIYVPGTRHPAVLFVVAVFLAAAGLMYPEPTLLALQAAVIGLVLTVIAGLLERSISRRRRGIVTISSSGSAIRPDSTQTQLLATAPVNGTSTQSAPQAERPSGKTDSTTNGSNMTP